MPKFVKVSGLIAVTLGGVTLSAGTARALSCGTNVVSAPVAGDAGVPTDTLLWGYPGQYARLLGPSGERVDTDERTLPVAGYPGMLPVLVPREPLEPNADYTIVMDYGGRFSTDRSVFTTGAGPASGAPALPVLLSSERRMGGNIYGITRGLSLTFGFDGILLGDTGQVGDTLDLDALFEAGDRIFTETDYDALPIIQWVARDASVFAGISPCGVWPRDASDTALGRFGVLDLAGRFSGWLEVPLELPSQEEAEQVAAAQIEARNHLNVQQGRPPACAVGVPGDRDPSRREPSLRGLLALGLALTAAGGRRAWRRRHNGARAWWSA